MSSTAGVGLFLHEASRDYQDQYFESPDIKVPIHTNIYIDSDVKGNSVISGKIVDQIDDLYLIFDRTDGNNYPFEEVALVLENGIIIWRMTSTCAEMLELATVRTIRHENLPQIVIKLPLWLSKEYNNTISCS